MTSSATESNDAKQQVTNDKKTLDPAAIEKMLPIRMTSTVVRGFGRGSSDLGIPTANLDIQALRLMGKDEATSLTLQDLPCGIYWGFGRRTDTKETYTAALSMGYNPTYGNKTKTVEPHFIAPNQDDPRRHASSCGETVLMDFYDQSIRLSVVGYLRPELPFDGLEKLVVAIKKDIAKAEQLGDSTDPDIVQEREWVQSDSTIN